LTQTQQNEAIEAEVKKRVETNYPTKAKGMTFGQLTQKIRIKNEWNTWDTQADRVEPEKPEEPPTPVKKNARPWEAPPSELNASMHDLPEDQQIFEDN